MDVSTENIIVLYSLHIESVREYCSTAFHSLLSQKLSNTLKANQKNCLQVILAEVYVNYTAALEMWAL